MTILEYNEIYHKDSLKAGFTTGSCATAASKAAFLAYLGIKLDYIDIKLPNAIILDIPVAGREEIDGGYKVSIVKYAGDDPDITDGIIIEAVVKIKRKTDGLTISIDGGEGVGRVTKAGLDRSVGEAAINSMPRKMIENNLMETAKAYDFKGQIDVLITVPQGMEIGAKTFNPRLGIVGGISILGTSGIVHAMSKQAIIDTIKTEINMHILESSRLVLVPGNYGMEFAKNIGVEKTDTVEISNFIGESLDLSMEAGGEHILMIGHIGKFVKLAAGIMNTHSNEADGKNEIFASALLRSDMDLPSEYILEMAREILCANTTEEIVEYLMRLKLLEPVMKVIMEKMYESVCRRLDKKRNELKKKGIERNMPKLGIITFVMKSGEIGRIGDIC